ncbi:hypothetical protein AURDEDRAFT_158845 [Auricularia subglabra TFB-10046 SS5]|nr:hypothetical protein AURDEDRAFT_158845 [Auricularia subglabra TFB-10046 SS5]
MYPYHHYPPVFPVTPNVTPVYASTVPLPPSPYGHPVALPPYGPPHPGNPYAYGIPPYAYTPYYAHGGLPPAVPPPQYPQHASQIHGLLQYARFPRIKLDVAKPLGPLTLVNGSRVPQHEEIMSAILPNTTKLRLISPGFPWVIDIDTENPTADDRFNPGAPITVRTVIEKIHSTMRNRMSHSEWLICDKKKRAALTEAFRARCGSSGKEYDNGLCWVDYLKDTQFYVEHPLTPLQDDKVVEEILHGREKEVYETWVIIFGPPR